MHSDTAAYLAPDCCISRATVSARRAPEAPSGWPMAIAPPFGLTRRSLRSTFISLRQPSTWLAPRHDLALVEALLLGGRILLLGGERKFIRLLARDAEIPRDVVAGLGHRMVAVLLDESRVREARADGGVVHLGVAAIGCVGL